MADGIKPIRRVVTGNDAQGRSCVLYDSAAPNVNANAFKKGTGMTDIWVFHNCPAVISGERDDGNLPFHFEPPHHGGHLRIVQSSGKPKDYDPAKDPAFIAEVAKLQTVIEPDGGEEVQTEVKRLLATSPEVAAAIVGVLK